MSRLNKISEISNEAIDFIKKFTPNEGINFIDNAEIANKNPNFDDYFYPMTNIEAVIKKHLHSFLKSMKNAASHYSIMSMPDSSSPAVPLTMRRAPLCALRPMFSE